MLETHQINHLRSILGRDAVVTDLASRSYFSTDLSFQPEAVASAVLKPDAQDPLA